jgi:hypothetical protein
MMWLMQEISSNQWPTLHVFAFLGEYLRGILMAEPYHVYRGVCFFTFALVR